MICLSSAPKHWRDGCRAHSELYVEAKNSGLHACMASVLSPSPAMPGVSTAPSVVFKRTVLVCVFRVFINNIGTWFSGLA